MDAPCGVSGVCRLFGDSWPGPSRSVLYIKSRMMLDGRGQVLNSSFQPRLLSLRGRLSGLEILFNGDCTRQAN